MQKIVPICRLRVSF